MSISENQQKLLKNQFTDSHSHIEPGRGGGERPFQISSNSSDPPIQPDPCAPGNGGERPKNNSFGLKQAPTTKSGEKPEPIPVSEPDAGN